MVGTPKHARARSHDGLRRDLADAVGRHHHAVVIAERVALARRLAAARLVDRRRRAVQEGLRARGSAPSGGPRPRRSRRGRRRSRASGCAPRRSGARASSASGMAPSSPRARSPCTTSAPSASMRARSSAFWKRPKASTRFAGASARTIGNATCPRRARHQDRLASPAWAPHPSRVEQEPAAEIAAVARGRADRDVLGDAAQPVHHEAVHEARGARPRCGAARGQPAGARGRHLAVVDQHLGPRRVRRARRSSRGR